MSTVAPERRALAPDGEPSTRAERALTEPMAVVPLGEGRYDVVTDGETVYTVVLPEGRCTCPDHRHRGARCKHLRRVAIDVTDGRVPGPEAVAADCVRCGEETFTDPDAARPPLCAEHDLAPGDAAVDRETGSPVRVLAVSEARADGVEIPDAGVTVADYPTNRDYPRDDPVVAAVYDDVSVDAAGTSPGTLRVYSFPLSRLSA